MPDGQARIRARGVVSATAAQPVVAAASATFDDDATAVVDEADMLSGPETRVG